MLFNQEFLRNSSLAQLVEDKATAAAKQTAQEQAEQLAAAIASGNASSTAGGTTTAKSSEGMMAIPPPEGLGYIPINTDTAPRSLTPGSNVVISSPDEYSASYTSYQKLKEIRIMKDYSGMVGIYWNFYSLYDGFTVASKLYKNGIPYGQEKLTTLSSNQNVSNLWPQDFVAGDLIQIYGKIVSYATTVFVNNLEVRYSWQVSQVGGHNLDTPFLVSDTDEIEYEIHDP